MGVSGWTFLLLPVHSVSPRQRLLNGCVCVCVCITINTVDPRSDKQNSDSEPLHNLQMQKYEETTRTIRLN